MVQAVSCIMVHASAVLHFPSGCEYLQQEHGTLTVGCLTTPRSAGFHRQANAARDRR